MSRTWNRTGIVLCWLLALFLSGCSGVLGGSSSWQASGLQQNALRALIVDPNNSQHLYAGDDAGHVFETTDGGQHWSTQALALPAGAFVTTFAFSANGKQLYAGTLQGLFITDDAGNHWQLAAASAHKTQGVGILALAVLAGSSSSGKLCIATDNGVFLSADGGKTWSYSARGLDRSALVRNLVYDPNTHQLWAATSLGVYRSDDQAASWQAFNTGLPAAVDVNSVVPALIAGGAQGRIYAGTKQGFFISTDDGAHWAASHNSLERISILAILVDFRSASATTLYLGTSVGALRSDNGGQNWGGVASGLTTPTTVYALQIGGDSNSQLFAATNNGLYLYPGSSGNFDLARILSILLAVLVFAALYLLVSRRRRVRRVSSGETK